MPCVSYLWVKLSWVPVPLAILWLSWTYILNSLHNSTRFLFGTLLASRYCKFLAHKGTKGWDWDVPKLFSSQSWCFGLIAGPHAIYLQCATRNLKKQASLMTLCVCSLTGGTEPLEPLLMFVVYHLGVFIMQIFTALLQPCCLYALMLFAFSKMTVFKP